MAKVVDLLEKYYFDHNYNCAEAVFCAAVEAWGLDVPADAVKGLAAFGGGMGSGLTCGALVGGAAALSYKFVEGDGGHTSPTLMNKTRAYVRKTRELYGSTECKDLRKEFFKPEVRCFNTISKIAAVLDEVYDME